MQYFQALYRNYPFTRITQEDCFTVYQMAGQDGEGCGEMRCCQVLPGIYLSYNRLDMRSCYQKMEFPEALLEINHCAEGCYEVTLESGQVCFLGEGDLCITAPGQTPFHASRLPLEHYRGISIVLDPAAAQQSLQQLFPDIELDLPQMQQYFFQWGPTFLIRARAEIDHIFAELYQVDPRILKTYLILKVVELLLFLSLNCEEPQEYLPQFSQAVVAQTKAAHDFLLEAFLQKITVSELSSRFHLAETSLRECFKAIYGQPIASFLRAQRMRHGALLLRSAHERSIGEIARLCGYENQSKFSAAFQRATGKAPLAYRRWAHAAYDDLELKSEETE